METHSDHQSHGLALRLLAIPRTMDRPQPDSRLMKTPWHFGILTTQQIAVTPYMTTDSTTGTNHAHMSIEY
jgi:hypothetical protein